MGVVVTMQVGFVKDTGENEVNDLIDIPTLNQTQAHEVWAAIIAGYERSDRWVLKQSHPGFRHFRGADPLPFKYISIYVNSYA